MDVTLPTSAVSILLLFGLPCLITSGAHGSPMDRRSSGDLPVCTFDIWNKSETYFDSRLESLDPHFIEFGLTFDTGINMTVDPEVLLPTRWVWTFSSPTGTYPYLSWNIDHGVLSFGLLDAMSIEVPYIHLHADNHPCAVAIGNASTTWKIAHALTSLVNISNSIYHQYEKNYFCYLAVAPGIRNTMVYSIAVYFNFPIDYLNYNCCMVRYFYSNSSFGQQCFDKQIDKWSQCILMPYLLGIIIFLYFPILIFDLSAWLARDERIVQNNYHPLLDVSKEDAEEEIIDTWMFLDGSPPLTLSDTFSCIPRKLKKTHPVLVSRLRRIFALIIGPVVILIQLLMYRNGMGVGKHKITVPELVQKGTPVGFLGLLAHAEDSRKVFAPLFGGPVGLIVIYYTLGFIFIVFPRSVKQIVENGLPTSRQVTEIERKIDETENNDLPRSPLLFSTWEIIRMSMVEAPSDPGYKTGASLLRCSFYMLFTRGFWIKIWKIQKQRFRCFTGRQFRITSCLKVVLIPVLVFLFLIETLLCVVFYAVPFFSFVIIMVKGATIAITNTRFRPNSCPGVFFRNPIILLFGSLIILTMFLMFVYSFCLIFIQGFSFLAQVIIFCFIAVIVYPSTSFGYLFFFVVLLYYFVHLIRDFGDGYLELLSSAVEKSQDLENHVNFVTIYDGGQLVVSNVRGTNIKSIRINDRLLSVPQNTLQGIESALSSKTKRQGNMYGIPKDLFYLLVRKFRPVHIQFLKLVFQLALTIILVVMTMSITSKFTSGPTSEISDVMHVIFLVTVGALPRVLEVALMNESEVVKKEIEGRKIEQCIMEYWHRKADEN